MKKLLQLLLGIIGHLIITSFSLAQGNVGSIYGSVVSDLNETIPLSTIVLYKESEIAAGIITDDKGNFILGEIEPGIYDLKISSVGFSSTYIRGIEISQQEIQLPLIELSWGLELSSVLCLAERPTCVEPCGMGCICECCVPQAAFEERLSKREFGTASIDTLNYLSLESWRNKR
jgi:hypothetical protein